MSDTGNGSSVRNGNTKIGRLIAKYDLDGMAAEMEESWTCDGELSKSTRELAEYFNKAVLRRALRETGTEPLDSELDTIYQVLSAEKTATTEYIEIRERLAKRDIDVRSLTTDFVSHQTVYNFLTEQLDVEYQRTQDPQERLRRSNESVQKVKHRMTAVARTNIQSLENADLLTLGDFDVMGEVYIYCQECGSRFSVSEIIDRGGCECAQQ